MYLTTNGTPIVIADDRGEAARLLNVDPASIAQVDELGPRDRHPELVEALEARRLFALAC